MVNLGKSLFAIGRENWDVGKDGKDPADRPATPKEDEAMNLRDIHPEGGDEDDSEEGDEKDAVDSWGF